MALSGSLPQINLGVQGETQRGLHNITSDSCTIRKRYRREEQIGICAGNGAINCGHRQGNGTTLSLLTNILQHHDGRILVWRHRSERLLNCCVMHHSIDPAPSIMIWGDIGFHCRALLVRIAVTLKGQRNNSEM
ncbi:transposable element Tcb1 transposase [Trichonephila clavipes]|nr:transposable element Tcb1 transposase [Trichonephila clavipes]